MGNCNKVDAYDMTHDGFDFGIRNNEEVEILALRLLMN